MSRNHEDDESPALADALAPELAATWAASRELRSDWRDHLPDAKAGGVALLAMGLGAWGVLSGFALFMLLHESAERFPLWVFVLALGAAAVVALLTEYLRERIEHGRAHGLLTKLPVTVLTLGLFELFISAWHVASEMGREFFIEAGLLILGPELQGRLNAPWAAAALAVLWVVEGAVLAMMLAMRLLREPGVAPLQNKLSWKVLAGALMPAGRSALIGGLSGAIAGAVGLLLTVAVMRAVAAIALMITEPEQWLTLVTSAPALVGAKFGVLRIVFIPVALLTRLWMWGAWGPLLTIGAIALLIAGCKQNGTWWPLTASIAGLVLVILTPLAGSLSTVLGMAFLAGLVWLIPGFCLGAAVPLLKGAASAPRVWSLAAFVAAIALMVVSFVWRQGDFMPTIIGFAVIIVLAGVIFWVGGDLRTYWPFAALVLASYVAMLTAAQQATFSGVLNLLSQISAKPTAPGSSSEPGLLDALDRLKNLQFPEPVQRRPASSPLGAPLTIPGQVQGVNRDPMSKSMDEMLSLTGNRPHVVVASPLVDTTEEVNKLHEEVDRGLKAKEHAADAERQELIRQGKAIDERREALAKVLEEYLKSRPLREGKPNEWPDSRARVTLQKMYILQHQVEAREQRLLPLTEPRPRKPTTAELFELSVTGSLAFWVTVGLLVGWSTRQHEPVVVKMTSEPADRRKTCFWGTGRLQKYHDEVHGRLPANDRELFERLALEMLGRDAWARQDELRKTCLGFDVEKLANANPKSVAAALRSAIPDGWDLGIKMAAVAQKFREVMTKVGGTEGRGVVEDWSRRATADPEDLVKALRRGLGLPRQMPVGNFLLATGMVEGGHFHGCWKSRGAGETQSHE